MAENNNPDMIYIPPEKGLWNRCYTIHSLVIIGTKEEDGGYNMAPKHMAMPLGFGPYFGFMGTPRKTTYQNVEREKVFTVSFPAPEQVILSSLTASRRESDDSKPVIEEIPTTEAAKIEGKFLKGSYLQLECRLKEIIGKFDEWEMIVGEVIAAYANKKALRTEGDDSDSGALVSKEPLLAYLHPDRFSIVKDSYSFPFPKDFKR